MNDPATAPPDAELDSIGPYKLLIALGEEPGGKLYLARSKSHGDVAVRLLSGSAGGDPADVLSEEIGLGGRLRGRPVAAVLNAGRHQGRPYVVTEHLDGQTLEKRLAAGTLGGEHLVGAAAGILTGLMLLHEAGVVHRSVEPANVLLGAGHVHLVGLGTARLAEASAPGQPASSPAFTAPERFLGASTASSDLWSWAATIVFAATGRPPFGYGTADEVRDGILRLEPDLGPADWGEGGVLRTVVRTALTTGGAARPSAHAALARILNLPEDTPAEALVERNAALQAEVRNRPAPAPPAEGPKRRWHMLVPAAMMVAAAAVLLFSLPGRDGGPAPGPGPRPTRQQSTPAGLDGTWQGSFRLTPDRRRSVRVVVSENGTRAREMFFLDEAATRPVTGGWSELNVLPATDRGMTLEASNGSFHVTLVQDGDTLRYAWRPGSDADPGPVKYSGTLRRT